MPLRSASVPSARVWVAGVVLVTFGSGCLSNEYTIKREELIRLASLPPEARGERVRINQDLGERRGDEVEAESVYMPRDPHVDLYVSGGGGPGPRPAPGGWRSSAPGGGTSGSWRGSPPSSASGGWHGSPASSGWHGLPPASGGGSAGGWRGSPPSSGGGSSSGGGFSLPSGGGGGGGGGDAWPALIVAIIIGAAVATVVLAASEGMRYAGDAQMSPDQTIYVKRASGGEQAVPLGALTLADATAAEEAIVKDDEGYGLLRLGHAPIDRTGGTFRFELGGGAFNYGAARASGFSSHIQAGLFVTPWLGLLLDVGLDGGDVDPSCCVGPIAGPTSLRRDSIGGNVELMPFLFGPVRLGAYVGGGVVFAGPSDAREQGGMASAGARLELELTSHMALSVRAGGSTASLPSGWSTAGTITGGLAIY
jgi:hypothetical protein